MPPTTTLQMLQLCRPLSGAVIRPHRIPGRYYVTYASIVPPPFGSGYGYIATIHTSELHASIVPPPFGSGYAAARWSIRSAITPLQLCRPLSGAVIGRSSRCCMPARCASIVPPPFGSGYRNRIGWPGSRMIASIVPPPFGSGYVTEPALTEFVQVGFNCAAPFRERLSQPCAKATKCAGRFNCAAPFRERLWRHPLHRYGRRHHASIVPPPFGSGYGAIHYIDTDGVITLQLCRPLSGAVIPKLYEMAMDALACFNCAAPFRERLFGPRPGAGRAGRGFNCAAPFRERLFPVCCRSPVPDPRFNCAAPFRERLYRATPVFMGVLHASIVPPPFGSGYPNIATESIVL